MASNKVAVSNLAPDANEEILKVHFGQFGQVVEAAILENRTTAYVTYADQDQANAAIAASNDQDFLGQSITVRPFTGGPGDFPFGGIR
ncbi:uncharacterized protein C8A04DRAFT_26011 [Dichotomopilus funicola]|uniref:RRM domain-containing protein n=1 Tax=Dichotomopilus funicola TaxID=1934379 RepID=A0AAN6V7A9_9PEZI|nr:hypothetical protein C8A04DRAFT_26011 [Dichotomopilus funicola]